MADDTQNDKADEGSGGTAASSVADQLVNLILGDLSPGSSLPSEANLAAQFDVSRLTVREAVKMVAGRGLLELARGRRAVVREPSGSVFGDFLTTITMHDPKGIFDIIEVRQALEIQSATLAARRSNRAGIAAIEHALDGMRRAAEEMARTQDAEKEAAEREFHTHDVEFHEALALASGNRMITYLIEAMAVPLRDAFSLSMRGHEMRGRTPEQTIAAHERILAFVREGDSRGASQAMRAHLEDAERDARAVMKARMSDSTGSTSGTSGGGQGG